MNITIKKLSNLAIINLGLIKHEKSFINTNTKAIEYALEQYNRISILESKLENCRDNNDDINSELSEIKDKIAFFKNLEL